MVDFITEGRVGSACPSLGEVVAATLALEEQHLRQLLVSVELDFDADIAAANCLPVTEIAISGLMHLAISLCPQHGELQISVCKTMRGIEIEIANSCSQSGPSRTNAFTRCDDLRSHKASRPSSRFSRRPQETQPDIYYTRCPQGGLAWTVVVHHV